MSQYHILVINPGSTSTKIAVYRNYKQLYLKTIRHEQKEIAGFPKIADQYQFRKDIILNDLKENHIQIETLNLIMGRGGLLKPIPGGAYEVNDAMLHDIRNPMDEHESNLGGLLAYEIAKSIGPSVKAFIVDPTCVDELQDMARISGLPELPRKSFLHALNQKAVARRYTREKGINYEDMNLIVVHMGGGITVGAHSKGRITDVNNGLNGDGPFSPERTGGLPVGQLIDLCFSGKYTREELRKKVKRFGGLFAYLGTNDAVEIEERINTGDKYAELIYNAMAYQIGKEIGGIAAVFNGQVDAILLTGGLAYSKYITEKIKEMISFIAPVYIYAGEDEMEALAYNGMLVLTGEITPLEYK